MNCKVLKNIMKPNFVHLIKSKKFRSVDVKRFGLKFN